MSKKTTKLKVYSKTSRGRKIKNEDYLKIERFKANKNEIILAVLADGMGGHLAGEIASEIAVENFVDDLKKALKEIKSEGAIRNTILKSYNAINRKILEVEEVNSKAKDMGTTLTGIILIGRRFLVCSLGDTRAYRISSEQIQQITIDHSAGAESFRKGLITELEAKKGLFANSLIKYLGSPESFVPDIFPKSGFMPGNKGEVLLLCTDGISGVIDEIDIYEQVVQTSNIEQAGQNLIYLSYLRGSKDNMSAILIEIPELKRKKPQFPAYPEISTAKKGKKLQKKRRFIYVILFIFLLIMDIVLGLKLYREFKKYQRGISPLKKEEKINKESNTMREKISKISSNSRCSISCIANYKIY